MGREIFKLIKRDVIRGATSVVVAIFLNIVCGSLEAIPAYQVGRSNNSNDLVYACDVEGPKLEMYEDAKEIQKKIFQLRGQKFQNKRVLLLQRLRLFLIQRKNNG